MSGKKAARWGRREEGERRTGEEDEEQRILFGGSSWNSADLFPHTMIADMFRSSAHSGSDPPPPPLPTQQPLMQSAAQLPPISD